MVFCCPYVMCKVINIYAGQVFLKMLEFVKKQATAAKGEIIKTR